MVCWPNGNQIYLKQKPGTVRENAENEDELQDLEFKENYRKKKVEGKYLVNNKNDNKSDHGHTDQKMKGKSVTGIVPWSSSKWTC